MSTHAWQPHGARPSINDPSHKWSVWAAGIALGAVLALLVASAVSPLPAAQSSAGTTATEAPLSFAPNVGQTNGEARFVAHAAGASFYFTPKAAVLAFARGDEGLALRLGFVGANPAPKIEGRSERAGEVNYLTGSNAAEWQTGVPTFGAVVYRDLWPGIDMVFRGANGSLKYEFVVQAGASARDIQLAYRGADGLAVSRGGELLIETPWGTLRDEKPRSYQMVDGRRVPVESRFALGETAGAYGFALGAYEPSRPLVIDPGLLYSTFLGGSGFEEARHLTLGSDGSAYVTGFTTSPDFPSTAGAFDTTRNGPSDGFVTKLNEDGSLAYSTFLGGTGSDSATAVAVDAGGNAYVAGVTDSADFPTTPDALESSFNGIQDAFVARLSSDGSALTYSTYLGGFSASGAGGIALGADGSIFVIGSSNLFPTTSGAFDETLNGTRDGFVARVAPDGSEFIYSTYLGGAACDLEEPIAVAVDASGSAYVTGYASSPDFPTTPGAYDETPEGCGGDLNLDAFVTKLNPSGSELEYSTMLAGETRRADFAFGITVDDLGHAFVAGTTQSPEFPTTPGAFDQTFGGNVDAFVTELNATGSDLVFSTFLGGSSGDDGTAIALDDAGDVFVVGLTGSPNFPVTQGALDESHNGSEDAFLARLDPLGSELRYGTYFGGEGQDTALFGLGVDNSGNALFGGYANSADFPTSPGAFDTSYGGSQDGWVAKLATEASAPDSDGDGIPDDQDIEPIRDRIDELIPGPADDKLEDALAKVDSAIAKLDAGDRQGALGELEGAVGDIRAAVNSRNLDATVGTTLMRDIAAFARIIATQSIDAAKARNGDARKIAEAEAALAQGDARVTSNRFKEAVAKYKDSVAKAESA